jgi:beta-lactamase class A
LFRQAESGRFGLGDELPREDIHWVGGSGVLRSMSANIRLPIRDYAYLMMSVSDNIATNMLIDLVGIDSVNAFAADLGLVDTRLRHKIDFGHAWDDPSHLGVGTPREFSRLMQLIHGRDVLSAESCDDMMRMMGGVGADRIGRFLPLSTYDDELRKAGRATGPMLRIAGKTGGLIGVRGHTAVVWGDTCQFVLTVMTDGSTSHDWGVENDGILAIARIGKLVYDAWSAPAKAITMG